MKNLLILFLVLWGTSLSALELVKEIQAIDGFTLFATSEDLTGLPPHVISVNELDPLRDEGLLYYKKLLSSGVDASSITINGTVHAGDMIFINATPKIYRSSLMHINNFANSL